MDLAVNEGTRLAIIAGSRQVERLIAAMIHDKRTAAAVRTIGLLPNSGTQSYLYATAVEPLMDAGDQSRARLAELRVEQIGAKAGVFQGRALAKLAVVASRRGASAESARHAEAAVNIILAGNLDQQPRLMASIAPDLDRAGQINVLRNAIRPEWFSPAVNRGSVLDIAAALAEAGDPSAIPIANLIQTAGDTSETKQFKRTVFLQCARAFIRAGKPEYAVQSLASAYGSDCCLSSYFEGLDLSTRAAFADVLASINRTADARLSLESSMHALEHMTVQERASFENIGAVVDLASAYAKLQDLNGINNLFQHYAFNVNYSRMAEAIALEYAKRNNAMRAKQFLDRMDEHRRPLAYCYVAEEFASLANISAALHFTNAGMGLAQGISNPLVPDSALTYMVCGRAAAMIGRYVDARTAADAASGAFRIPIYAAMLDHYAWREHPHLPFPDTLKPEANPLTQEPI